jgi:transposase-like protein
MSKKLSRRVSEEKGPGRRRYTQEFKAEAVQSVLASSASIRSAANYRGAVEPEAPHAVEWR